MTKTMCMMRNLRTQKIQTSADLIAILKLTIMVYA